MVWFDAARLCRDKVERLKNGRRWVEGEDTPLPCYLDLVGDHAPGVRQVFVMTDDYTGSRNSGNPTFTSRRAATPPLPRAQRITVG